MKIDRTRIASLLPRVPLFVVVLLAFLLGYWFRGLVSAPPPQPVESARPAQQIWTCSMHPEVRLPAPGKCPKCGMDLIPAEDTLPPTTQPADKKYACAMMCVPPMSRPGKCPMCGMQMVEVHEQSAGETLGPQTLTLSPAARKLAEIEVAPVRRRFVEAEIRMVGKIDYDETRLKYITAWVPGRLDRLFVDYSGVPVNKGDHLVYMYSPELLVAQAELLQAIETVSRLKDTADDSTRRSAQALVEDAREKLRLWGLTESQVTQIEQRGKPSDHMTIYAPIGGIVVHKEATEGMYVNTGTRIYTIADLSRVWVKLDAYESDLAWLRYGQKVEFQTEAYPGRTFTGTIAFIDPVLNAATRTVKVRVNVDNADGTLKPQMFIRAVVRARLAEGGLIVNADLAGKWISPMHPEIVKDAPGACDVCGMPLVRAETLGYVSPDDLQARPPLVIPASAPLITGKRAVVYVELPGRPGSFQGREISLGARAGDTYIVRDGLAEGERVVINGNFKIDSAVQILARPSMMNPESEPAAAHESPGTQPGGFDLPADFIEQIEPLYTAYYSIQGALSLDAHRDAVAAARKLTGILAAVDAGHLQHPARHIWMKERDTLNRALEQIVAAPDIEKARAGFALLSESMIAVARRFTTAGRTVYRLHCPMAFNDRGADWLQDNPRTANPYFGSAMFRCGSVRETLCSPSSQPSATTKGER